MDAIAKQNVSKCLSEVLFFGRTLWQEVVADEPPKRGVAPEVHMDRSPEEKIIEDDERICEWKVLNVAQNPCVWISDL